MKLYYSTGACSLSPHIVLRELGLEVSLAQVNLRTGIYQGEPFTKINPKGYVPVLELDDGERLTEGAVIVQYLADLHPEKGLLPEVGTLARVRCQEWLTFVSTELHKGFSPLFSDFPESVKAAARQGLEKKFTFLSESWGEKPFLTGEKFTVADAYLFTVLNWPKLVGMDLAAWPTLVAFQERVRARPAVQAALKAEGLK
jgi:glutathione S-transferase